MDLTKLAFNFSVSNADIDLTIVSMSSEQIVRDNVEFLNELSDHEKQTLEQIRNTYEVNFSDLSHYCICLLLY